jgi:hypothetical protein
MRNKVTLKMNTKIIIGIIFGILLIGIVVGATCISFDNRNIYPKTITEYFTALKEGKPTAPVTISEYFDNLKLKSKIR